MSVKFVLLYLCHTYMYFSFFLSRKQGNNERVLLESLKSKYKNILLGFKELKQMKQEKAQEEKAQETTTVTGAANADTTNSVATQKYLQQIRNAIVKLATYICKKSSGQNQLAIKGIRKEVNDALKDATFFAPSVAKDIFKGRYCVLRGVPAWWSVAWLIVCLFFSLFFQYKL
jgi:hypothetical protein